MQMEEGVVFLCSSLKHVAAHQTLWTVMHSHRGGIILFGRYRTKTEADLAAAPLEGGLVLAPRVVASKNFE
jgi:hypothetical protein